MHHTDPSYLSAVDDVVDVRDNLLIDQASLEEAQRKHQFYCAQIEALAALEEALAGAVGQLQLDADKGRDIIEAYCNPPIGGGFQGLIARLLRLLAIVGFIGNSVQADVATADAEQAIDNLCECLMQLEALFVAFNAAANDASEADRDVELAFGRRNTLSIEAPLLAEVCACLERALQAIAQFAAERAACQQELADLELELPPGILQQYRNALALKADLENERAMVLMMIQDALSLEQDVMDQLAQIDQEIATLQALIDQLQQIPNEERTPEQQAELESLLQQLNMVQSGRSDVAGELNALQTELQEKIQRRAEIDAELVEVCALIANLESEFGQALIDLNMQADKIQAVIDALQPVGEDLMGLQQALDDCVERDAELMEALMEANADLQEELEAQAEADQAEQLAGAELAAKQVECDDITLDLTSSIESIDSAVDSICQLAALVED